MKRVLLAAVLVLASLTGCGSGASDSATIVVFAAASLRAPFTEIGKQFGQANPGVSVQFSFAGSSDLVTQLTQGARADVFASADVTNMDKAVDAGLVAGEPLNFASNTLTIAVAPGNPKGIASLRDLTRPDTAVVVCAPQVPCGAATRRVEQAAGVD
ncbi:MAG: molybdate ABC transporter substrate-binding protein, partial [Actinomycetota bacterium]|nr:molybdate ABC transporter substrate-binding protein [Actinomycetota bacterium]